MFLNGFKNIQDLCVHNCANQYILEYGKYIHNIYNIDLVLHFYTFIFGCLKSEQIDNYVT